MARCAPRPSGRLRRAGAAALRPDESGLGAGAGPAEVSAALRPSLPRLPRGGTVCGGTCGGRESRGAPGRASAAGARPQVGLRGRRGAGGRGRGRNLMWKLRGAERWRGTGSGSSAARPQRPRSGVWGCCCARSRGAERAPGGAGLRWDRAPQQFRCFPKSASSLWGDEWKRQRSCPVSVAARAEARRLVRASLWGVWKLVFVTAGVRALPPRPRAARLSGR